jgi:MerR family transcriptional regulator, light-induced transcriptional regulator
MGLLNTANDLELHKLAQKIYDHHFRLDPELEKKYDDRSKQLMFQDIIYNLGYLKTAVQLNDDKLFPNYASWLFELLCSLMKHTDREQIKDQMILHYSILSDTVPEIFPVEEVDKARGYILQAIDVTQHVVVNINYSDWFLTGNHVRIRQDYLHAMLRSDSRGAVQVIEDAAKTGISLVEIYEDILQVTMYEVGELWHRN